jgi:endonuclease/exonuclease/phosphatase family metal-dependent hydrolase
MRRLAAFLAITLALAACADDTPLQPRQELGIMDADPIVVMSRNLYLGADIDAMFAPGADLEEALANAIYQVSYTDFGARAVALAQEITSAQPHVAGLQEVVAYSLFLSQGYPVPTEPIFPFTPPPGHPLAGVPVNFLQTLMAELGSGYEVAVYQPMLGLPMPIAQVPVEVAPGVYLPFTLYIHYQDGGAIIVRSDVAHQNAAGHVFSDLRMMSVAGMDFPRLMGWTQADVKINDRWIRFASAHLENQDDPAVQEQQAAELAATLKGSTLPVILVGDFNSAANNDAPADRKTGSYKILRASGLADLWLRQPQSNRNGNTCCHAPLLDNPYPAMDQRLDIVFARFTGGGFGGRAAVEIVGRDDGRFVHPYGYTLWPSDHAGVVARLWPAN